MSQRVVIIGGGFAGIRAARDLSGAEFAVTLVDRTNHHVFQPLLYQVATAGLGATDIAAPLRKIFRRQRDVRVVMDEVETIELDRRQVLGRHCRLDYDYLIVAAGASHTYFGNDAWENFAPGLKTLDDATTIRSKILRAFEAAERETDPARRQHLLTFVIVGSGPTGVELAGAISEMARHTIVSDFRSFDSRDTRVLLLDAADRVLPPYDPGLSAKAERQLEALGVEVRVNQRVVDIDESGLVTENADGRERIHAATVLWAAGVKANPLGAQLGTSLDRAGRVQVESDLSLPGRSEVFVVGDLAAVLDAAGRPVPGVAPAAMQQGAHVARTIRRERKGRARKPFRYRDKGAMATIGRSRAVAEIFGLKVSGLLAWIAWLVVHLLFLVGFRNRISVLFDWVWSYLTYQRSARLIVRA